MTNGLLKGSQESSNPLKSLVCSLNIIKKRSMTLFVTIEIQTLLQPLQQVWCRYYEPNIKGFLFRLSLPFLVIVPLNYLLQHKPPIHMYVTNIYCTKQVIKQTNYAQEQNLLVILPSQNFNATLKNLNDIKTHWTCWDHWQK